MLYVQFQKNYNKLWKKLFLFKFISYYQFYVRPLYIKVLHCLDLGIEPSVVLYPTDYCNIIEELTLSKCFENSLLGK